MKWEKYLTDCKFQSDLKIEIEKQFSEIFEDIKQNLDEISEDLKFFNEFRFNSINFKSSNTFSFRSLFDYGILLSSVGTLVVSVLSILSVATGPIGWIMGGLAIGFAALKGLFESTQKKRQRAEENIINSLKDGIETNRKDTLNKIETEFDKIIIEVERKVISNFATLKNGIDSISSILRKALENAENEISNLNKIFAFRIINFIQYGSSAPSQLDLNIINQLIVSTKRDYGKSFTISCSSKINDFDKTEIAKTLQEDIIINQ